MGQRRLVSLWWWRQQQRCFVVQQSGSSTHRPASDQEAVRFCCKRSFQPVTLKLPLSKPWLWTLVCGPNWRLQRANWHRLAKQQGLERRHGKLPQLFSTGPADPMVWNQLMTSSDAPCRRMALALSEIFVTSTTAMTGYWPAYPRCAYWDVLCTHAFGNYRDLLDVR